MDKLEKALLFTLGGLPDRTRTGIHLLAFVRKVYPGGGDLFNKTPLRRPRRWVRFALEGAIETGVGF
jgi:hypothetical protein